MEKNINIISIIYIKELLLQLIFQESTSDSTLVPRRFDGRYGYECPNDRPKVQNHDFGYTFCSCEPYCSWDKCRLLRAPDDCLTGTRSTWLWDVQRNYWVAQEQTGTKIASLIYLEIMLGLMR